MLRERRQRGQEQLCGPVAAPLPPATSTTNPADEDIEVSSQGAELSRTGDALLKGKVDVRQGDRHLSAEDVQYDDATQSLSMEGNVEYQDPLVRVRGDTGKYDAAGGASFGGAEFELPSRPARGAAKEIVVKRDGQVSLDDVRYTTCPVGNEDWVLKAGDIDLDTAERNGTGRRIRLDFKGVPILYTPYISFPLGNQRSRGFLFPEFGVSDRNGVELGSPYYFNLAPNFDLLMTPRIWTNRGLALRTSSATSVTAIAARSTRSRCPTTRCETTIIAVMCTGQISAISGSAGALLPMPPTPATTTISRISARAPRSRAPCT